MITSTLPVEPVVARQVFETWSIEIPLTFAETFVREDSYWHAWDRNRSVSLTSIVVTDGKRPVAARRLLRRLPPSNGDPVKALPPGLDGWAVVIDAPQPARATRALTGMLFVDGRVLLATVTADDMAWARSVWLSIRRTAGAAPTGAKVDKSRGAT